MAQKVIEEAHAVRVAIVKGTPYHTGEEEDFEETLATLVHADRCGAHEWFERPRLDTGFQTQGIRFHGAPRATHGPCTRATLECFMV